VRKPRPDTSFEKNYPHVCVALSAQPPAFGKGSEHTQQPESILIDERDFVKGLVLFCIFKKR
jgi:hypothetical protein